MALVSVCILLTLAEPLLLGRNAEFQRPLVAQRLQIVSRQIGAVPEQGIAPVEAPEKGDDPAPGHVPVLQMEQLVEDHLFVGLRERPAGTMAASC